MRISTQVAIVGAGPAGLLLSHLLHLRGVESAVVEIRSRDYVEHRVRAGVLEQGTVDLLDECGAGSRMRREGLVHRGIELRFEGRGHRIDFPALTGGRTIMVYGQQEVVKDLIALRLAAGGQIWFDADDVSVHGLQSAAPCVRFVRGGEPVELECAFVAGCDGFHGVCRETIPAGVLSLYERVYPFSWLGILAQAPPPSPELIYASHERGFALFSMRSPAISRLYLQVAPDEETVNWPDARIWRELRRRLDDEEGSRLGEVGSEPLIGLLAHGARVEDDHVGHVLRPRLPQSLRLEHALDPLGIVRVHLASEGRDEVGAHVAHCSDASFGVKR